MWDNVRRESYFFGLQRFIGRGFGKGIVIKIDKFKMGFIFKKKKFCKKLIFFLIVWLCYQNGGYKFVWQGFLFLKQIEYIWMDGQMDGRNKEYMDGWIYICVYIYIFQVDMFLFFKFFCFQGEGREGGGICSIFLK